VSVNDGPVRVSQRTIDPGVAAVQVSGELDLATVGELAAGVERALTQGSAPLLIDFSDCGFIDSSVISLLVGLRARLGNSRGSRFAVVADNQPLRVLRLTELDHEMPVFTTLPEALRVVEVTGATEPWASVDPPPRTGYRETVFEDTGARG
jgi:anti-anti-sigma factor